MINWSAFWTTLSVLFLAEMGDKTQLAAITLSAQTRAPLAVFLGASLALVLVSLIGVALGALLGEYLPVRLINKLAAVAFIVVGVLMLWGKM